MARWRREKRDYSHLGALPPSEVFERAVEKRPFGDTVMRWEYYANRDLIDLFGEREEIGVDEVVELDLDMLARRPNAQREEATPFNYERAGNLIGWGLHLGLLRETPDASGAKAWRLVDRAMRWELHKDGCRQFRGLPPGEQAALDRKRATEAKREATLARKHAEKVAPQIKRIIDRILADAPDTVLDETFAQYLSPFFTPPQAIFEAYGALLEIHHGWDKGKQQRWVRDLDGLWMRIVLGARFAPRQPEPPETISDDAAALGDLI